jgi:hypothetical protein
MATLNACQIADALSWSLSGLLSAILADCGRVTAQIVFQKRLEALVVPFDCTKRRLSTHTLTSSCASVTPAYSIFGITVDRKHAFQVAFSSRKSHFAPFLKNLR